jgi:hypothetical protein
MVGSRNLMNSIWFGEKTTLSQAEIKEHLLKSHTERDILFNLIELYKSKAAINSIDERDSR